jgi:hypothetical protein
MYPAHRFGKTKPIPTPGPIRRSAFPGAVCAKQTQLPEAGHRGGVGRWGRREPLCHYSIVPVFQGDL